MVSLEIVDHYHAQVDSQALVNAAKLTLQSQGASVDSDLTIVITDDEQLRMLNAQFRDIDAPTDVLSFPADFTDPENEAPYLGDVVISFERATAQAALGGHLTRAELQLLVVHGVLHLLGHDHAEPEDKTQMWATQTEILRQLGLEDIQISGDD